MNGYLNKNLMGYKLTDLMGSLPGEVHVDTLAEALVDFLANARRMANMSLSDAAHDAVTELGPNAKIQAIKKVRELTGCGLKEAKDAVEAEVVGHLADAARTALVALAQANSRLPQGARRKVWVYDESLTDAVDVQPF